MAQEKRDGVLNELAERIYQFNITMGWHAGSPDLARFLMNLHSEISEMWEAWRDNKIGEPCDKAEKMAALGHYPLTCFEEEIADIIIRALDTARAWDIDIDHAVKVKMAYNATRAHRHGGKQA